jgi:hypothetical protein
MVGSFFGQRALRLDVDDQRLELYPEPGPHGKRTDARPEDKDGAISRARRT